MTGQETPTPPTPPATWERFIPLWGANRQYEREMEVYQKSYDAHMKTRMREEEQAQQLFQHFNSQRTQLADDLPGFLQKEGEAYAALQEANRMVLLTQGSEVAKMQAELAAKRYDIASKIVLQRTGDIDQIDRTTRNLSALIPMMGSSSRGEGSVGDVSGETFERPAYASPMDKSGGQRQVSGPANDTFYGPTLGEMGAEPPGGDIVPANDGLDAWRQEARGIGLGPEARVEGGQLVYDTDDPQIAAQWQKMVDALADTTKAIPPIIVRDRSAALKEASAWYEKYSDNIARHVSKISAYKAAEVAPKDVQNLRSMAEMARNRGDADQAEWFDLAANAPEAQRVSILREAAAAAIEERDEQIKLRQLVAPLHRNYLKTLGAEMLMEPEGNASAAKPPPAGLDERGFASWYFKAHGKPKTAAEMKAYNSAWAAYSGGNK